LIDFIVVESLGWPNGEHHKERKKTNGEYTVGIGHNFLFHLTSLLSSLGRHEHRFKESGIVVPEWLWNLTARKAGPSENLKCEALVYEVKKMRHTMIGYWVLLKSWQVYLNETNLFLDSVDKLQHSL
jgi:hypothetical protein